MCPSVDLEKRKAGVHHEATVTGKQKRKSEFIGAANIKSINTGFHCEVKSATVVRKPA